MIASLIAAGLARPSEPTAVSTVAVPVPEVDFVSVLAQIDTETAAPHPEEQPQSLTDDLTLTNDSLPFRQEALVDFQPDSGEVALAPLPVIAAPNFAALLHQSALPPFASEGLPATGDSVLAVSSVPPVAVVMVPSVVTPTRDVHVEGQPAPLGAFVPDDPVAADPLGPETWQQTDACVVLDAFSTDRPVAMFKSPASTDHLVATAALGQPERRPEQAAAPPTDAMLAADDRPPSRLADLTATPADTLPEGTRVPAPARTPATFFAAPASDAAIHAIAAPIDPVPAMATVTFPLTMPFDAADAAEAKKDPAASQHPPTTENPARVSLAQDNPNATPAARPGDAIDRPTATTRIRADLAPEHPRPLLPARPDHVTGSPPLTPAARPDAVSHWAAEASFARSANAFGRPDMQHLTATMARPDLPVSDLASTAGPVAAVDDPPLGLLPLAVSGTGNTAVIPSPLPAVALAQATLPQHLATDIAALVATPPDGPVTLQLRPEELGTLHFQITRTSEGTHLHLTVDQSATLDLLRRHGDDLLSELQRAGYAGTTFSFAGSGDGHARRGPDPEPDTPSEGPAIPDFPTIILRSSGPGNLDLRL